MNSNFYSPLTLFLAVGLLSFTDPKSLDRNLQSLSFALDSTNKSVESIKNGMDTLNYGIEQIIFPAQGSGQEEYSEGQQDSYIQDDTPVKEPEETPIQDDTPPEEPEAPVPAEDWEPNE